MADSLVQEVRAEETLRSEALSFNAAFAFPYAGVAREIQIAIESSKSQTPFGTTQLEGKKYGDDLIDPKLQIYRDNWELFCLTYGHLVNFGGDPSCDPVKVMLAVERIGSQDPKGFDAVISCAYFGGFFTHSDIIHPSGYVFEIVKDFMHRNPTLYGFLLSVAFADQAQGQVFAVEILRNPFFPVIRSRYVNELTYIEILRVLREIGLLELEENKSGDVFAKFAKGLDWFVDALTYPATPSALRNVRS